MRDDDLSYNWAIRDVLQNFQKSKTDCLYDFLVKNSRCYQTKSSRNICDALRNLLQFVQFKKRAKRP